MLTAGTLHGFFPAEVSVMLHDLAGFAYALAVFVAVANITWRRLEQSPTVAVDSQTRRRRFD
jgi:hypothetical protein